MHGKRNSGEGENVEGRAEGKAGTKLGIYPGGISGGGRKEHDWRRSGCLGQ